MGMRRENIVVAGKLLRDGEVSIRVLGNDRATVVEALDRLRKVFDDAVITGLRANDYDGGWRGYLFAKIRPREGRRWDGKTVP